METEDSISKLYRTLDVCDIHLERLRYATNRLKSNFPLTSESYQSLEDADISVLDQMIFRFTKLQDSMGRKLFPQTLLVLEEDFSNKPFIDMLLRMEKLNLIPGHQEWIVMREVRNELSHEYPVETGEIVDGLNSLYKNVERISSIYTDLKSYLMQRFQ